MTRAEIRKRILADNDAAATELRRSFDERGTLVLNLISSPGSGKTSLLEATVRHLPEGVSAAAFVGDIATDLDAERVRRAGIPAHQIGTGGACHLDARMVYEAIERAPVEADVLFIENVGNLVCPASFALGEDFKVVCLSVTEGWDKPFKYPGIFRKSACTVITKADMLAHVDFDVDRVSQQVHTLNPEAQIFVTSAVNGQGLDAWCGMIAARLAAKRERPLVAVQ